ncbi:MAG: hypothetical protein ACRD3M_08075 [Thermoanaerobaculia bacterium]
MLKNAARWIPVVLACSVLVACGKEKRMADSAIKAAETTVASAGEDVGVYAADQWKQITDSLAAAKESFAKGDYKAALASVADIGPKVQEAQGAASTKKTELENAWNELAAGLPKMLDAVKSRADILSASRKLPAGMDKAKLEGVTTGLASATQTWNEASEAFKAGNLTDAVSKGNSVKDSATKLMQDLGMSLPAAAGGAVQ